MTLTLFSLGCTSLFINQEKPKTVKEKSDTPIEQKNNKDTDTDKIQDFKTLTSGIISDISSSGDTIALVIQDDQNKDSLSQQENKNTLSLYYLKNQKIRPILSSRSNIKSSKFDAQETGLYYLENIDASDSQLYWIDDTGHKKIKISSSDHFISSNFYLTPNNDVYYGTKDGKIIQANKDYPNYIISTINLGTNYNIQQIYYSKKKKIIVFSAYKNEQLNLYTLDPKTKKINLVISKIAPDFSFSKNEDNLLYTTVISDSNKRILWLMNLRNKNSVKIVEGFPHKAIFSSQENQIIYLDKTDPNNDLQNIWVYDLEKKKKKQIASNLKIASDIYWNPKGEGLLFSTYDTTENQLHSRVYLLKY